MNHKRFLLICGDYRILFMNCSLHTGRSFLFSEAALAHT
ncbi:hypothetical protein F6453_0556 [Marinobacter nauticus]|uniref:Uncharacterized protein n=1 Tax=Marinobacter nauticus TaxID=2743 RepID=A0A833N9T6_MARNT|nr:hypothetical protein F6453_0556 [Marinobacter nauticus]